MNRELLVAPRLRVRATRLRKSIRKEVIADRIDRGASLHPQLRLSGAGVAGLLVADRDSPIFSDGKKPLFLTVFLCTLPFVKASDFFSLPASLAPFAARFPADAAPWEWIKAIAPGLSELSEPRSTAAFPAGVQVDGQIWLHPTVKLPAHATLIGPLWIGAHTEIRPGAYIRGNVIVGERCVLGNSCEFKNCLLMDGVQVPHFSYVGDSILGNRAHLGAGVICSNLRLDQQPVVIRTDDATYETGLRKFGAILGDEAEVGCNAVLQPGTLLGPRALVMPLTAFGGFLPAATIARTRQVITALARKD